MSRRYNRNRPFRGLGEPLERLAQANLALVITQAILIRISVDLAEDSANRPDSLLLVAFLAGCIVAGWLVYQLNRIIRRFPQRWQRIAIAVGTVLLQAAAFQLLHAYAS